MSKVDVVGGADGWRCWLCDEPVDPAMSVNDPRGPSVDTGRPPTDRLAHRACNTRKGAVAPVAPWGPGLFVVDPAPIIGSVDRLQRKGGRVVMARCPDKADGDEAAAWLVDRLSRLYPGLAVTTSLEPGGGQFLLVLHV
jgi:hypothetical protein